MRYKAICAVLTAWLVGLSFGAAAQEADAKGIKNWLGQFSEALSALSPLNDPTQTADPARPKEYLLEYEFGTVTATAAQNPKAEDIMEIDVRTDQVTDCRGMRVGMTLSEALHGMQIPQTDAPLVVLDTGEMSWCWAYWGNDTLYGVEWMAYDIENPSGVTEYTLTYVVAENSTIEAIRVKAASSTQAQAESGLRTAREMLEKQQNGAIVLRNTAEMVTESDLTVMGVKALGMPVYEWIEAMGEPIEVQTLSTGGGRILLYEGAAVTLGLDTATGIEVVRGVSVTGSGLTGARGLQVGMSMEKALSLFRCDADVSSSGGILYIEGEAYGEPPYGEMTAVWMGTATIRYACLMPSGEIGRLEIGIENGNVSYWHIDEGEEESGV